MTISKNKPLLIGAAAVLAAIVGWLAFGYFGVQAAFIDNEVSEAGPVFTAAQPAPDDDQAVDETAAPDTTAVQVVELIAGDFAGQSRYAVNGKAVVLNDGSDQRFLRFENFESTNGPDLKVYLRAANGDFVSLGDLRGNIGDQNYEIPVDVDLSEFNTVEIWCERFSVGFGSAVLG